jgi:site-specific DNA recombinase
MVPHGRTPARVFACRNGATFGDHPQRELFRTRVVEARAKGKTEREVAADFGITVTAAQKAAVLQRRMDELGITDPYVRVTDPPEDSRKMRRNLHSAYRFEPLPGAGEI